MGWQDGTKILKVEDMNYFGQDTTGEPFVDRLTVSLCCMWGARFEGASAEPDMSLSPGGPWVWSSGRPSGDATLSPLVQRWVPSIRQPPTAVEGLAVFSSNVIDCCLKTPTLGDNSNESALLFKQHRIVPSHRSLSPQEHRFLGSFQSIINFRFWSIVELFLPTKVPSGPHPGFLFAQLQGSINSTFTNPCLQLAFQSFLHACHCDLLVFSLAIENEWFLDEDFCDKK